MHEPERQKTVNCIAQSAFPTIGIHAFIKQRHIQFCRFEVFFLNLLFVGTLWNHVCANYRRRTTKTVHRISIPRMIVIIRQVLKRILRCSLRIVKPCLALFLCSYQFIMTPNDQIKAKAVFLPPQKPTFQISIRSGNSGQEPPWGIPTAKSIIIIITIIIRIIIIITIISPDYSH